MTKTKTRPDQSSLIDALGQAALDARAAVKEVHEAIRDARLVIKELNVATARAETVVHETVDADVGALVKETLDGLGEQTQEAIAQAVEKVGREFQRLENIFLGRERNDDRPPLEEIVRRAAVHRKLVEDEYDETPG